MPLERGVVFSGDLLESDMPTSAKILGEILGEDLGEIPVDCQKISQWEIYPNLI